MQNYDVAIVGAGIGGLVCGCNLAKRGLKVLICERHFQPGGYCTSFDRRGFRFDVGVHSLGSLREGGILFNILKDLELLDRIKFITSDLTDRIVTPDKTVCLMRDRNKTKEELIINFPREKENIDNFFSFILNDDFLYIYSKTRHVSFKQLLDSFFIDYKLKAVLSVPLISIGLPPARASALVTLVIYKEFIFDGGYYPQGGMQSLPNLLTARFKEYGGTLLLSTEVVKILTKNKKISGVKTIKGDVFNVKTVVSNADASLTFKKLLDCRAKEAKLVDKLKSSISAFVVYLGLNKELDFIPKHFTTGLFSTYDIDRCFDGETIVKSPDLDYLFCIFSSRIDPTLAPQTKSALKIFTEVNFFNKNFWLTGKEALYQKIIRKVEVIIPGIEDAIEVKEIATPNTFYRYTLNKNGALFGWSALPTQVDKGVFPNQTSIENLYLTGHWVTNGIGQSGIAVVALFGKYTADKILEVFKKQSNKT